MIDKKDITESLNLQNIGKNAPLSKDQKQWLSGYNTALKEMKSIVSSNASNGFGTSNTLQQTGPLHIIYSSQTGNAELVAENLSDGYLLLFYMYFWMCSWLLIIPRWLIDDSGPIARLFDSFFGTSDFFTKSGPADPVFITKICQKYQKLMGTSLNIVFFISEKLRPENPGNHVQCALLFF